MKSPQTMLYQASAIISRWWIVFLLLWVVGVVAIKTTAPPFADIVQQGEFDFLPENVDSRQAERIFRQAFDKDMLRSLVIISVRRTSRPEGLTSAAEFSEQDRSRKSDYEFIENDLRQALITVLEKHQTVSGTTSGAASAADAEVSEGGAESAEAPPPDETGTEAETRDRDVNPRTLAESAITTYTDRLLGSLLVSKDGQASLVLVELPNDFLDTRNGIIISDIEHLLYDDAEFRQQIPPGLELTMSGTATVGRDMNRASKESAEATERVTVILVVCMLIVIYRAPVLAFIPLLTAVLAINSAISLLALMALYGWVGAFDSLDVYVTVVSYGAGVDYCLFLIARYREELEEGYNYEEAVSRALAITAGPLIGSAGTSVVGIGMMIFTSHKKFQQAGIGISFGLIVALIAALTLTPALLRIFGKWSFWPNIPVERPGTSPGWVSRSSLMSRLQETDWTSKLWKSAAAGISAYPGRLWILFVGLMAPFAILAVLSFNDLSYGLLSELPVTSRSVVGSRAVQQHFPAGTMGPSTILLMNQKLNFLQDEQVESVKTLSDLLYSRREQLGLVDIYSSAYPLGMSPQALEKQKELEGSAQGRFGFARRAAMRARVMEQYVGKKEPLGQHVTRLDLIFSQDPFERGSIAQLDGVLNELDNVLPKIFNGETEAYALGSTASIRDMKLTTDSDQMRVLYLVLIGVYLVLVMLLRKPAVSFYLILTVFFSYLTTLGVTSMVFWAWNPEHFAGLDWKVRMFLFTILIAIGEDYNIFLMARVDEERAHSNPIKGVLLALTKTGSIISSCGIIMAGTFCSLMFGSLVGMQQLGFALAFGVLLDTFIVRPILVPAYLVMLERGFFGPYSRAMGAISEPRQKWLAANAVSESDLTEIENPEAENNDSDRAEDSSR